MENVMIFLTNLVYVIFAIFCFIAFASAISILEDVIKICLSAKPKAATPEATARDAWLARLEQESYIMSLKVVTEDVNAWATTQEEINVKANMLKERISERRSNYELLNKVIA